LAGAWFQLFKKTQFLAPLDHRGYSPRMTLKAIVHPAEDGGFWAEVPALPGCFTQGETVQEIRANLQEAIEGWLLAAEPEDTVAEGEIVEVAV
jgi:predicted RNase H-like HicB family nuclease